MPIYLVRYHQRLSSFHYWLLVLRGNGMSNDLQSQRSCMGIKTDWYKVAKMRPHGYAEFMDSEGTHIIRGPIHRVYVDCVNNPPMVHVVLRWAAEVVFDRKSSRYSECRFVVRKFVFEFPNMLLDYDVILSPGRGRCVVFGRLNKLFLSAPWRFDPRNIKDFPKGLLRSELRRRRKKKRRRCRIW